jgi:hypothetical protein
MKKGSWQSRSRTCKQVASPEGKEARVRKPFKKPRQVTVKETQDGDSEGPTQLGVGETVDNSSRIHVSEFYVGTETELDKPITTSVANVPLFQSPASSKSVSDSSDAEDNRPIHETIRSVYGPFVNPQP